jgi:hypothetical protein
MGKLLVTFLPDHERSFLLKQLEPQKRGPNTITTKRELRRSFSSSLGARARRIPKPPLACDVNREPAPRCKGLAAFMRIINTARAEKVWDNEGGTNAGQ